MDKVLKLATNWTKKHLPSGGSITIKESKGKTPLILVDIPGQKAGNVLMYGHLDKQPEMDGWDKGMGPWKPVLKIKNFTVGVGLMMAMPSLLLYAQLKLSKNNRYLFLEF